MTAGAAQLEYTAGRQRRHDPARQNSDLRRVTGHHGIAIAG